MVSGTYVDGDYGNAEDGDPDCDVEIRSPVSNHQSSGCEVRWSGDDVLQEIVPARCKTTITLSTITTLIETSNLPKSRINHTSSISTKPLIHRQERRHLAQSRHDKENRKSNKEVRNQ